MTTSNHRYVRLTGLANGARLSTYQHEGAEHLVVPVVALVGDIVVRPLNSSGPEFVPAQELATAPASWNGRPVMPDHPSNGTASANDPKTLEAQRFGWVFDSKFEDGRLKVNAYLDVARAERMGGDALRVVERCRAGEMVEVSVGAWITAERRDGMHNGERYEWIWRGPIPDHLAMLPEGAEGACSANAGCGAPRAAEAQPETPRAVLRAAEETPMDEKTKRTLRERLRGLFTGPESPLDLLRFRGAADGMSDADLRMHLDRALFAMEPGYLGIDAVYPADNLVIYAVAPDEEVVLYRRSYTAGEDGEVTLAEEREAVEFVGRYEPVAAEAAEPETKTKTETAAASADCGCKTKGQGDAARAQTEETTMSKMKDLIGRLIQCDRSPYTEADAKALGAFGEARLEVLAEAYAGEPAAEPEPKPKPEEAAPAPPAAPPKPKTEDEWMAEAPESLRRMFAEMRSREAREREERIAALAAKTTVWTKEELAAMSTDALGKLAKALETDEAPVHDYSMRPAPTALEADLPNFEAPDTYGLRAAEAARKAKAGGETKEAN